MAVAERLNSILDAEDESDVVVERAPDASAGAVNGASTAAITRAREATVASLTAKLRVYQTQFSEYASEKSVVDSELAEQLARVLEGLGGAPGSAGDGFAVLSKVGIDHGALTPSNSLSHSRYASRIARSLVRSFAKVREELAGNATEARLRAKLIAEEHVVDVGGGADGVAMNGAKRKLDEDDEDGGDVAMEEEAMEEEDGGFSERQVLASQSSILERSRYIPIRLEHDERRLLRLLEGALNVSEYTDKVDILSYRSKSGRVTAQVKDLCAILCGLVVAQNFKRWVLISPTFYARRRVTLPPSDALTRALLVRSFVCSLVRSFARGKELIEQRDFAELQAFFQGVFEIGRRYKVMNPDKMRDTYGKLMVRRVTRTTGTHVLTSSRPHVLTSSLCARSFASSIC